MKHALVCILWWMFFFGHIPASAQYTVKGTVWSHFSGQPLSSMEVRLTVYEGKNSETYTQVTDQQGHYQFELPATTSELDHQLMVYAIDHLAPDSQRYLNTVEPRDTLRISAKKEAVQHRQDLRLHCATCGEGIVPPFYRPIHALGHPALITDPDDDDSIQCIVDLLNQNPYTTWEVQVHSDARGTEKANEVLSQKRAERYVNALVERGVSPDRLLPVGYGEDRLLVSDEEIAKLASKEAREAAHGKNRRMVLKPIAFDFRPEKLSVFVLKGVVKDVETKEAIDAVSVTLNWQDSIVAITLTDSNGRYQFDTNTLGSRLIAPEMKYTLILDGLNRQETEDQCKYFGAKGVFSTKGVHESTAFTKDFHLVSADCDYEIPLPVIYFEQCDEWLMNDQVNVRDSLGYMYSIMIENPTIVVEVGGHAKQRWKGRKANEACAREHAERCVDFLVEKGIAPERLIPVAYGEKYPAVYLIELRMLSKAERAYALKRNNRVVFNVVSFDYVPLDD